LQFSNILEPFMFKFLITEKLILQREFRVL
jgi:hypothetical protein